MKCSGKIIFLLFFIPLQFSFSQSKTVLSVDYSIKELPFGLTGKIPKPKPKIALALSGGGARGLAQVGILRALEENDIPIDIIVGTSMGSVVGGLYSAGYTLKDLDSVAVNTRWDDLLSLDRETNRQELFIDQKITEDKAVFALRLRGLKPILPTSINNGQKLSNYLNLLALQAPLHVKNNFDELNINFRAVCTDLVTGSPVIISSGSLSQAMRASSSVSFFLSPVLMDSLVLVDGGLVANIPVKISSSIGGEYIIAVNTTSALHKIEDLNYPWFVADQVVSIPMKLLNEAQLDNADVIINPELNDHASDDFSNIDSLIQFGYKSTMPHIQKIKYDIDSIFMSNLNVKEIFYKNILIDNTARGTEYFYLQKYSSKDSVSNKEILMDLYSLFSTGEYENLQAEIIEENSYSIIKFIGEKSPVIQSVDIKGITLISKIAADSLFRALVGTHYSGQKILDRIVDVLSIYREEGYSLAELDKLAFNKETGRLSLSFNEGVISKIVIEGNNSTSPTIIMREFPLREGEYFLYDKVEEGLINLRSTNLFDDIVLTVQQDHNENILILRVLEKISSLMRVGFKVDNENKAQFSFDIRDENLFGGGTELGLILFGGTRNRAYVLEHKSNRIFNTYLTYKIDAYYTFDDAFVYADVNTGSERTFSREAFGEYRQIYYGTSLSLGTQVERFGNVIFKGQYQFDQIKNKRDSSVDPYKLKIVSLKISSTIDTQNKYPYAESGFYFNGAYETAQTILGGDIGFTNLGFEYKSHFTFGRVHTISPKLIMGFGDKTLPLSRQYSLGGQNSFFGMNEDEFRGRQIFLTSVEYRYKLPVDIFFDTYAKIRYDLGSMWDEQERIRFKDLRHGVGAVLSFDTPIGPADFAVGRSFLFKKNAPGNPLIFGDINFYFSIGYYY